MHDERDEGGFLRASGTVNFQPPTPAVSARIILSYTGPLGRSIDTSVVVAYRVQDPYAVTMTFVRPESTASSPGDINVTWHMSRALLLRGLTAPAGHGDVRVSPSIDAHPRAVTLLDFSSPEGRMIWETDTEALSAFLARTLARVPLGMESSYLDIDVLIELLLHVDD